MSNDVLKIKIAKWKKNITAINKEKEVMFDDKEKSTFSDTLSILARAGQGKSINKTRLQKNIEQIASKNNDRMQSDFSSAVAEFTEFVRTMIDKSDDDKDIWKKLYAEAKDLLGDPETDEDLDNAIDELLKSLQSDNKNKANDTVVEPKTTPRPKTTTRPTTTQPKTTTRPTTTTPQPNTTTRPVTNTQPKTTTWNNNDSWPRSTTQPGNTSGGEKFYPSHFSFSKFFEYITTYGIMTLLGFVPFLAFKWAGYLFDTDHWFWGLVVGFLGICSIGMAWVGWLICACIILPLYICTTSWWLLGVLMALAEVITIYCICLKKSRTPGSLGADIVKKLATLAVAAAILFGGGYYINSYKNPKPTKTEYANIIGEWQGDINGAPATISIKAYSKDSLDITVAAKFANTVTHAFYIESCDADGYIMMRDKDGDRYMNGSMRLRIDDSNSSLSGVFVGPTGKEVPASFNKE